MFIDRRFDSNLKLLCFAEISALSYSFNKASPWGMGDLKKQGGGDVIPLRPLYYI